MKTTISKGLCRTLCALVVLALFLPMLPTALAATAVANIDGRQFTSVESAWEYAMDHDGSVIEMLTDWKLTDRLTVEDEKTVTIHMHGHMINRGKVERNRPTYGDDSFGDGSIFELEDKAKLTIYGRDTAEELRTYSGSLIGSKHIWVYDGTGDVALEGGLITGGATDSDAGGAFTLEEECRLELRDVTLAGNIADEYGVANGSGGAILVEDDSSTVIMQDCTVAYNYAEGEGGAICVDDGEEAHLTLRNCSIHDNWCDGYGGAICVLPGGDDSVVYLKGSQVFSNTAKVGGGVFLDEEGITLQNGTIRDNTATKSAGGVFVGDTDCTLQDATVIDNTAASEAGVYVIETLTGQGANVLYLNGKTTIKGNEDTAENSSNLHLDGEYGALTNRALLGGSPSDTSEIWVSTDEDGEITVQAGKYNDSVFKTDDTSKIIYWNQTSGDEYFRYLMIGNQGSGQTSQITTEKMELDPTLISPGMGGMTRVKDYNYEGWPVYRGIGGTDSTDLVGAYYYSDGYFLTDPYQYNEHLATLSLRLAMAAMNSSIWKDSKKKDRGYTLQPNHIKQMLSDIGVSEENIFLSETYLVKPGTDTIAYAIGSKTLLNDSGSDSGKILVPIAVRGAGYEAEWASNVTIGDGTTTAEHQGFREAADQVLAGVEAYIDNHGLRDKASNGQLCFWIVGFSRAGATANLVSKSLVDKYKGSNNSIYGYDFEAPQGGAAECLTRTITDYDCIHNILLSADLVPHVAMISMGFLRYGVDHFVPGTDATDAWQYPRRYSNALKGDTEVSRDYQGDDTMPFRKDNVRYDVQDGGYQTQKTIMLNQLAASDHSIVFDDYFHLATFELISSSHVEEFGSDDVTAAQWLPDFIYYLNQWLTGTTSSRTKYVNTFQYQSVLRTLMEASNTGTLNMDKAMDRLLDSSLIFKILEAATNLGTEEQRVRAIANLLFDAEVFAEDAIPLTRAQAYPALELVDKLLTGDMSRIREYRLGTSVDYGDEDEYFVMLATLVYNSETILQNHNHQVVYAWLRSYDSYYLDNVDKVSDYWFTVRAAKADEVDMPTLTYTLNGTQKTANANEAIVLESGDKITDIRLNMSSRNAGGQVFYTIDDTAFIPDTYYANKCKLDSEVAEALNDNETIVITAETVWYNTPSEYATFIITRNCDMHYVYVDSKLYGAYASGTGVSVSASTKKCYDFRYWLYKELKATAVRGAGSGTLLQSRGTEYTVTDSTINFSMPSDANVYLTTNYEQRQVAAPKSTLPELASGQAYSTDRELTLYSDTGTEEDGVSITYTVYMEDDSGMKGEQYGSDSPIQIFSMMGKSIDTYYPTRWKVVAKATCEGWLDSEESVFYYTVDYRAQEYVLEVVDGAVSGGTQDGQSNALYHPGDTVTVSAADLADSQFLQWATESDAIDPEDLNAEQITFRMPFNDVSLTAVHEDDVPTAPDTGDDARPVLWIALSVMSLLLCGLLIFRRRRNVL